MQLPNTRPDERFFFSAYIPRPWLCLNVGVAKLTVWGPYLFMSLAFGWFGGKGPKVRALQMYLGIKCDPTQTFLHGTYQARSHYVMVLTPKECAAFRVHEVDVDCTWTNMAGE